MIALLALALAEPTPEQLATFEAETRAGCETGDTRQCFGLVQVLHDTGRDPDAFAVAWKTCQGGDGMHCLLAQLLVTADPTRVPGGPGVVHLQACKVGSAAACSRFVELAPTNPRAAEAAAKGCELKAMHLCQPGKLTPVAVPTLTPELAALLKSAGIELAVPAGFVPVAVEQNPHLAYQLAYRAVDAPFEVRIAVHPLAELVALHERAKTDPNVMAADPRQMARTELQVNALNLSGGQLGSITSLPHFPVRAEFGASQGYVTSVPLGPGFETERTHATVMTLQRDDLATVTVVLLMDDFDAVRPWYDAAFHMVRFTGSPAWR